MHILFRVWRKYRLIILFAYLNWKYKDQPFTPRISNVYAQLIDGELYDTGSLLGKQTLYLGITFENVDKFITGLISVQQTLNTLSDVDQGALAHPSMLGHITLDRFMETDGNLDVRMSEILPTIKSLYADIAQDFDKVTDPIRQEYYTRRLTYVYIDMHNFVIAILRGSIA